MKKILILAVVSLSLLPAAGPAFGATNTTLCKIQDGTIPTATEVFVDSVVVTAIDMKPSTYGFWAQHPQPCSGYPNRQYSGVLVYMSYANPDTVDGVGLDVGDLVRVRGRVREYPTGGVPSVTEIDYPADAYAPVVHIIQKAYGMPPPVKMTVHSLGTDAADSANCEKWEGVWCRLDTLVCTEWYAPLDYAEWAIVELEDFTGVKSSDTTHVDDKLVIPSLAKPNVGDTLKTVLGVFSYEYGNYKVWPRSNDDVTYLSAPPAPNVLDAYSVSNTEVDVVFDRDVDEVSAEDPMNYSLETVDVTTVVMWATDTRRVSVYHTAPVAGTAEKLTVCNVKNLFGRAMPQCQELSFRIGIMPVSFVQTPKAGSDTSQVVNEQVSISGICTGASSMFGGFFLGTPKGKAFSGVYVFDSSHNVHVGDSVIVSSVVNEYYGLTEMYLPDYVRDNFLPGSPALQPVAVEPWVLTTPSPGDTAEAWEGVLVKLNGVKVATAPSIYGEWIVRKGADSVTVDNRSGGYTYVATPGDSVNVAGLVDYNYDVWKLQPRTNTDIVVLHYGAVEEETTPLHFAALRNFPNPFNPKTAIEFGIPSPVHVKLDIYDVNGRLVRNLIDEVKTTGTWQVQWNGNDSAGHAVATGVYYCRLEAGSRVEMKKLVLVK
jgi:hypothetical protein